MFEGLKTQIVQKSAELLQEAIKASAIDTATSQLRSWDTSPEAQYKYLYRTSPTRIHASILRKIYKSTSVVFACVDKVVRQVTNTPWRVYPEDSADAETVKRFLERPNPNNETLQQLLAKMLTDMLILDVGVVEKVFGSGATGKLLELWARDASTFKPEVDSHGVLLGYTQKIGTKPPIDFEKQEVGFLVLHPQTDSLYGLPILETVTQEVATHIFLLDYVSGTFSEDEVPPGILSLGEIGDVAYNRAQAEFEAKKGNVAKRKIKVISGTTDAEWIEFKRSHRELEIPSLLTFMQLTVFRGFGLPPVVMGMSEGVPRSSAVVQERMGQSSLVRPLCQIIASFLNREVVQELLGPDTRVKFSFVDPRVEEVARQARADREAIYSGIRTINEIRRERGLSALSGGDRAFIMVGREIVYVDTLTAA